MKRMSLIILLFLTSCSSIQPDANFERKTASLNFDECLKIVNDILTVSKLYEQDKMSRKYGILNDGVVDKNEISELISKYDLLSDQSEELLTAFSGFRAGRMSYSVFNKLVSEFPKVNETVSALVFKEHLQELKKSNPKLYPEDEFGLIQSTFSNYKIDFKLKDETDQYYLIDIPLNKVEDVKFIGRLTSSAIIQPVVFEKNGILPTKRFFKIPDYLVEKIEERILDPISDRLYFTGGLRNGTISLEAANRLVDFDGSSELNITYQVSKARLKMLKNKFPNDFKGDYRDVESAFTYRRLDDKFVKISEFSDSVLYKITIKSEEDLYKVARLIRMSILGNVGLL